MAVNVAKQRQIAGGMEDALDEFDEVVRHGLLRTLSCSQNRRMQCFSYADCVSCCVGAMWAGLDHSFMYWRDGRRLLAARWLVEFSTIPLFVWPLCFAVLVSFVGWTERKGGHVEASWMRRVLQTTLCAVVWALSFLLLWLPGHLLVSNEESLGDLDILLMLRFFGLALLTRCVMGPGRNAADEWVMPGVVDEQGDSSLQTSSRGGAQAPSEEMHSRYSVTTTPEHCHESSASSWYLPAGHECRDDDSEINSVRTGDANLSCASI
eukprot:TRINITY_DN14363_c0_g2_i1.p1 TRINITY_DN14363_c0_g2~~TRINITY_DN14363_c0_g2_i1.p1  ORF type:complete len:265 (-),score=40.13 TRINITY_DN14363_c0_g2_i1:93-887(-)